jgi:glucose/arabinose dehydrogenase
VQFTADGKKMFVAVGSGSNVDDPDTTPDEKNRADILEFNPDGSGMRVYASGIRHAGGALAINPRTGELWCSVNERDGLGDNLVPDYITHVEEDGFYGWPWWYNRQPSGSAP